MLDNGYWRKTMRLTLIPLLFIGILIHVLNPAQASAYETEGIGWIPTWKQALTEAARAEKPILLIAAAPQCAGVPGTW